MDALRALIPDPDAPFEAWSSAIDAVAALVLLRCDLRVGDDRWRVTEVEGYVRAANHPDPFTHADEAQAACGRWYFHRAGASYRGGSFKGVDLTFGGGGAFAGMLIRAVALSDGTLIEGPSLSVDAMLTATGHGAVGSLARACEGGEHDAVALVPRETPWGDAVYPTPRVGLSLRSEISAERVFFLPRSYRFVVDPRRTRKGRAQIALGMHRAGTSPDAIAGVMGAPVAQVRRWIEAYERGRGERVSALRGAREGDELCALLGACDAAFAR